MKVSAERVSHSAQSYALALVLLCGLASLTWPFGADQAAFAAVGDVIYRGGLPYRDAWDTKGPLTYYVWALSQALFGTNQWGIRLVDFAILLSGSWALARTAGVLTVAAAGRWAALVFMLLYLTGGYWDTAQSDGWVALLLVPANTLLIVPARRDRVLSFGVVGALVGLCALMKWLYVSFLLLPLAAAIITPSPPRRTCAARVGAVLIGFLIPVVPCIVWFLAHGALDDLVEVHLRYPYAINSLEHGVTSLNLSARAHGIMRFVMKPHVLAAIPAIVVGILALWRTLPRAAAIISIWSAIAFGCVVLQSRFVDYHWSLVYPPLAVLCTVGLHAAWGSSHEGTEIGDGQQSRKTTPLLVMATVAVLAVTAAIHPASAVARWAAFAAGVWNDERYYSEFRHAASGMKAARYLREHTTERDQVVLWGGNAAIVYLSQRVSPTRFVFNYPLKRGEGTRIRAEYRAEFLRTFRHSQPAYFVVSADDWWGETPASDDLRSFPELLTYVMHNYQPERAFGSVTLYRRRDNVAR